jgi:hypothetical protein
LFTTGSLVPLEHRVLHALRAIDCFPTWALGSRIRILNSTINNIVLLARRLSAGCIVG